MTIRGDLSEQLARLGEDETRLVHEALSVLEANWMGHSTRPSPRLYPHQWSWDAAFIAIGYAHVDQAKAQLELESLFRGQWSNGLLPHIVFDEAGEGTYFPGPDFWQTHRSPYAPRRPRTSAIMQPPIHATAAWHVYRLADDRNEARRFLEDLLPRLTAWHGYLYRERTRDGGGLVEIWHPWESGMDNSPLWDLAMERLSPAPGEMPPYQRLDLVQAPAEERPTDAQYDRYVYLAARMREANYHPVRIRETTPFAIWDVLYNSLLVQANRDLAAIARTLGADTSMFEGGAELTAQAINDRLWDEQHGVYVDFDLVADEPIVTRIGPGFAPLYAAVPDEERANRLVKDLQSGGVRVDETMWAVPSVSPDDPHFVENKYWRGPIWINVNWVLYKGLLRYGFDHLAEQLRRSILDLPRRSGFWEHYHPLTGKGQGAETFAWTAALVLNLLFGQDEQAEVDH